MTAQPLERIGSNGGSHPEPHESPCDDLVSLRGRVNSWESRYAVFAAMIETRTGEMLRLAGEAAGNTKNAARDSAAAKHAAERAAARAYAPVNEVLEKYHDSVPPTDIEEPVSEITRTDIHSPSASLRRLREEQQKAAKAERELKAAKAKLYVALAGIVVPLGLALVALLSK
jgi:hypothetical protein